MNFIKEGNFEKLMEKVNGNIKKELQDQKDNIIEDLPPEEGIEDNKELEQVQDLVLHDRRFRHLLK